MMHHPQNATNATHGNQAAQIEAAWSKLCAADTRTADLREACTFLVQHCRDERRQTAHEALAQLPKEGAA